MWNVWDKIKNFDKAMEILMKCENNYEWSKTFKKSVFLSRNPFSKKCKKYFKTLTWDDENPMKCEQVRRE